MKYIKYMTKKYHNKRYNCWGFVRDFYKNELDINLNDLSVAGDDESVYIHNIYKKESVNWVKLEEPKLYCVIALANNYPIVDHVGIYLGNNTFIHNTNKNNVQISKFSDTYWKHKIVGCYEYKKI